MQMRSGGDLRSDAQTGRTQLASLRPCVRKGRRRRWSEFIEDVLGRDLRQQSDRLRAGWLGQRGGGGRFLKKGWARTILSYHRPAVGHILAIYLPKQPERVGHGGPSSKSVSNRPCAHTVREGVINSPKHQC